MEPKINYSFADQSYIELPAFAAFIKNQKLTEFVAIQIELTRQLNLPILRYFETLPEEKLIAISTATNTEVLTYLADNNASGQIISAIEKWISNNLPVVGINDIDAADITLLNHVRKQAFVKLIPSYTNDVSKALALVNEIDRYILELETLSLQTYIGLLNKKIDEHVHFIETITQTSPGIVYVFDLEQRKQIYSNNKLRDLLGFTQEEITSDWVGANFIHPDDSTAAAIYLKEFEDAKDGEIRSFRYRIKNKQGEYRWMRNYESVFKRNQQGKPCQLIGIALDVDKEKRAAEDLRLREEQLLEAQEMAQMGSYNWDIFKEVSTVTPQLEEIFGFKDHQPLKEFISKVHPADQASVQAAIDNALHKTGEYDCEFRYTSGDKEKVIWSRGKVIYEDDKPSLMKGTVMDVTDRHHMIKRLQRSEELYKQAQALSHIGNWTWYLKEDKVNWSDELYRLHGMEPQSQEITFNTVRECMHPEDRQVLTDKVQECLETKQPYEIYYRLLINNTTRYMHGKGELLMDEHGKPFKMLGTSQDITDRYLAELQLSEHEKYIQKITDAAPSLIAAYNVNTGKYSFLSKGVESLLGYDPVIAIKEGTPFFSSKVHPDDLPVITEKNNAALEHANQSSHLDNKDFIVEFSYRILHNNGHYRWLQTYGTVLDRDGDGKVEQVLNISMDITDRVHAEQKIKEQEHFIKHIADASPTILYVYDFKLKNIVYINQEIYGMLGYIPDEILDIGEDFMTMLFHPDDLDKLLENQERLLHSNDTSSVVELEARMKHKEDGWRYVVLKEIVFKRDYKGEVSQVLCAALDITERKKIEKELFDKTLELHQSNTSLAEFAYVASHDLKEPLRKISAFGDRLINSQQQKLDENGQFFLNKIIDSSKRMHTMIDDLLELSMISNHRNFERYSLQTILDEVLQTLEVKIERLGAIIETDPLPEANIIPSQFRQLFQNLLSNSLKFVEPAKQPVIKISCKTLLPADVAKQNLSSASQYLRIKFIDNGIGFNNESAEKIFVVFQRLNGRSEYDGTGIGLAICKRIVENHGGIITASGKAGEGATFTITLPV